MTKEQWAAEYFKRMENLDKANGALLDLWNELDNIKPKIIGDARNLFVGETDLKWCTAKNKERGRSEKVL